MIMIRFGLLLMFLSCVWTIEYSFYGPEPRYSLWPSVHNALTMRKREAQNTNTVMTEGGGVQNNQQGDIATLASQTTNASVTGGLKDPLENSTMVSNETLNTLVTNVNETASNTTQVATRHLNLNSPGVLMRSIIVFGGFLILAVVYYMFYKRKGSKNDSNNGHNTLDNNQFRYGFLQSEDRRDTAEFGSRVPLTLETDDDEEDDDLEIFDLGEKKKSLSYVNLKTNDEEIVFQRPTEVSGDDKDNILLDIEDATSDPLINWSNNGNKSIL